jgi:serine protease Do
MDTPDSPSSAAAIEYLTGPARGTVSWITAASMDVRLLPDRRLAFSGAAEGTPAPDVIARFHKVGLSYDVEAMGEEPLWINGRASRHATLKYGDVIEFGETGPLSRFRIFDDRHKLRLTSLDMIGDALSYLRTSRRPMLSRLGIAISTLSRRLARDTSLLFRALVLISLGLLAYAIFLQGRADEDLRLQIANRELQIDAMANALAEARREAIRPGDLAALQDELGERLSTNTERLMSLEARSGASRRIVSDATASIAFLQGGYSLRHRESGQMLRHVLSPDGLPIHLPNGQPYLSLEGDGPVAEVQFNGTGFVLSQNGLMVTNRHVAQPWGKGPVQGMGGEEMEPVLNRFIAYFPGRSAPLPLTIIKVSDTADLAILKTETPTEVPGLPLVLTLPVPGEEVIVMGYPTGLMSMLAQSGSGFVETLRADGVTGFWQVAERLAAAGLIAPLASRGIIGQATEATVVYDAETTHGGSGGPVLNDSGAVVAVNTAIIPEFGGSNLGVPAQHIVRLLEQVGE